VDQLLGQGSKMRAICFGELMVEMIERVESLPGRNSTMVISSARRAMGGAALNVAWYLGCLGRETALVSMLGREDIPLLRDTLLEAQVDITGCLAVPGHSDLLVAAVSAEEHRSVYVLADVPNDVQLQLAKEPTANALLVLNGGRHPFLRAIYGSADTTRHCPLSVFNPSYAITEYSKEELGAVLGHVSVVVVNADEFDYLNRSVGWSRLVEFFQMPDRALLITRSQDGVEAFFGGTTVVLGSRTKRDGVFLGAGDSFVAGFLHWRANGHSIDSALGFALVVAAFVVRSAEIRTRLSEVDPELAQREYDQNKF
jgi:sugar/nucleoside kinase (ribokinase family)